MSYVTLDDMGRYSDHVLAVLPKYRELDPIVDTLYLEHSAARDQVKARIRDAGDTRALLSQSQTGRQSLDDEVEGELRSLYYFLKSVRNPGFDFKRFFPTGRLEDIGDDITAWKASLQRCIEGLELYPSIPGGAERLAVLRELQVRYDPALAQGSAANSDKLEATASLHAMRSDWRRGYRVLKRVMEGLLVRARRESEYRGLFLDLNEGRTTAEVEEDEDGQDAGGSDAAGGDAAGSAAGAGE